MKYTNIQRDNDEKGDARKGRPTVIHLPRQRHTPVYNQEATKVDQQQPGPRPVGEQCARVKADGQRCRARALARSKLCYFHEPSKELERAAARRAGGVNRSRPAAVLSPETPLQPVGSLDDLKRLLSETINYTLRGEVDPKVANAVGQLGNIFLRVLDQGEIAARLAELEAMVGRLTEQAAGNGPGLENPVGGGGKSQ